MQRYLEPELMEDANQIVAFKNADRRFGVLGFMDFYKRFCNMSSGKVVDVGTGLGDYLIALKESYPNLSLCGYDGSAVMVNEAQATVSKFNISVTQSLIENINDNADLVLSTNTLHHIPDPKKFWDSVRNISNNVFVMDLVRPINDSIVQSIVDKYKSNDELYNTDFYNSLKASFSKDELTEQIKDTNLKLVVEGNEDDLQIAVIYGKFL